VTIADIQTPAVLIETETLHRNLRRMADYCTEHNLALRPHTKTHKIPEIAQLQVKYGASGITVAKLGEAEVMANAGISDINVVYPLWGDSKWRRLSEHLLVPDTTSLRVGDRLRVIPNHICPCINLQDHVSLVSGDQVLDQWKSCGTGMVT
jgi:D-serine deaminase-like pyridoxal phosphate-dependent protein